MAEPTGESVQVGQVWRDRDPRGGPTFIVMSLTPDGQYARVENTSRPTRARRINVARIPRHYELVTALIGGTDNPPGATE